jgi:hypothetical protein
MVVAVEQPRPQHHQEGEREEGEREAIASVMAQLIEGEERAWAELVGSIGPTRMRSLATLQKAPELADLARRSRSA